MHILVIDPEFCPPHGMHGTRTFEICRRLVRHGHDVTIVTTDAKFPDRGTFQDRTLHLAVDGLTVVVETGMRSLSAKAVLKFMLQGIRTRGVDAVIVTEVNPLAFVPACLIALLKWVPLVLDAGAVWPLKRAEQSDFAGKLKDALVKAYAWLALKWPRQIVVHSSGLRNAFVARGAPENKVLIVPNGADIGMFRVGHDAGAQFVNANPQYRDGPILLFAGRLQDYHNPKYLIDLACALKQLGAHVHFVVIGDGPERNALEKTAAERGLLNESFWMMPPVAKSDMPQAFSAATVALSVLEPVPEHEARAPSKVFDAFAAGRPIVINHGGWLKDLIDSRAIGLALHPTDVDDAARELIDFLSDDVRIRRAGEAAAALADTRFSLDKVAADFRAALTAARSDRHP